VKFVLLFALGTALSCGAGADEESPEPATGARPVDSREDAPAKKPSDSPPRDQGSGPDKSPQTDEQSDEPRIFGWKEWVWIEGREKKLRAKLDTGALTSSLHAADVKEFERDGEKWVRFTVFDPKRDDPKVDRVTIEAPLVRKASIKNSDGQTSERLIVRLRFRLGPVTRTAEFSLNDRVDLYHPVLLGRSAIRTLGLVDASRQYRVTSGMD